ncbi:hypothetical protein ACINWC743_1349 [Acinetobacter sp. WC-743]|nr:hypothetical protein ACINWC743_1349 [Acinetobacter sp. WC-743]
MWNQPLEIGLCNKAVGTSKNQKKIEQGFVLTQSDQLLSPQ